MICLDQPVGVLTVRRILFFAHLELDVEGFLVGGALLVRQRVLVLDLRAREARQSKPHRATAP